MSLNLDKIESPLRPKKKRTTLDDVEIDDPSLIRELGQKSLGGISAVGNILDIPGSVGRDLVSLLAGNTNANPLDQLLPWNWTSSEGRITGRDLNRQLGFAGQNDTWGNFAGGLATEVLLDPLTYLTLGGSALSRSGKAAKSAGLFDKAADAAKLAGKGAREFRTTTTLRDLATTPEALQKLENAFGRPLTNFDLDQQLGHVATFAGQGLTGLDRFAPQLDKAGDFVRYSPPVRNLARLFNAGVHDASTTIGQKLGKVLTGNQTEARASARAAAGRVAREVVATGDQSLLDNSEQAAELLRAVFEGTVNTPPQLHQTANFVDSTLTNLRQLEDEWGLSVGELDDLYAKYFPRQLTASVKGGMNANGRGFQPFSGFDPHRLRRDVALQDIEGGTNTLREISMGVESDPTLAALVRSKNPADTQRLARELDNRWGSKWSQVPTYIDVDGQVKERSHELAKWLKGLSPDARATGVYGNHPLFDLEHRLVSGAESIEAAKTIAESIADPNVYGQMLQAAKPGERMVPLSEITRSLDMNLEKFGKKIEDLAFSKHGITLDHKTLYVPESQAADLTRFVKGFQTPEALAEIMRPIDWFTNLVKGSLTTLFPAFHMRNLVSGTFRNWVDGTLGHDATGVFKDAWSMMRGGEVKDAHRIPVVQQILTQRGLPHTEAEGTNVLRELARNYDVISAHMGETGNLAQGLGANTNMSDYLRSFAGGLEGPGGRGAFKPVPQGMNFNPLDVRGVGVPGQGAPTDSKFFANAIGEQVGFAVEGMNRLTPWITQLRRGVDPGEAAMRVAAAQVDYSSRAYTKFEREALTRLVPFYKFSRGNVPYVLRQLYEHPGGRLAQTIRTTNRARDPNEVVPDYVANSASIPIDQSFPIPGLRPTSNDPRFLTGLGLMWEDPISFAGGGMRGGMLELASRLNPLLKGPLEYATNQSFFQQGPHGGRALEDTDPTIGRTISNLQELFTGQKAQRPRIPFERVYEPILMNSPLSRLLTTTRTLSDPRKNAATKAMQLLTGLRITDVPERTQDAVVRDLAESAMRELGAKGFEKVYFSEEELARMSPQEREEAKRFQALMNLLARRAKARKTTEGG